MTSAPRKGRGGKGGAEGGGGAGESWRLSGGGEGGGSVADSGRDSGRFGLDRLCAERTCPGPGQAVEGREGESNKIRPKNKNFFKKIVHTVPSEAK